MKATHRAILMTAACLALSAPPAFVAAADSAPAAQIASPAASADATLKQVQEQIDKGVEFLKANQAADGTWQGEKDPPGITALVLRGLVRSGKASAKDDYVRKGYEKLLTDQKPDGGVYKDALANYNTALAVSALVAANDPSFKERTDRAVKFLHTMQWTAESPAGPDGKKAESPASPWWGGFTYLGKGRPDLSNTTFALDALHDAGVQSSDPAFHEAVVFLTRCQNRSESNDQKFAGEDGGAIYTPANGEGASAAGAAESTDGVKRWNSYGAMTYGFIKGMLYAGVPKPDPRLKAAHDWVSKHWTVDEHPGMRLGNNGTPGSGLFYYYVMMSRALHAWGDPIVVDNKGEKHDWRVELGTKLASLQKPDGSWTGEKRWRENNSILATAYALNVLEEIRDDLKEHPAAH